MLALVFAFRAKLHKFFPDFKIRILKFNNSLMKLNLLKIVPVKWIKEMNMIRINKKSLLLLVLFFMCLIKVVHSATPDVIQPLSLIYSPSSNPFPDAEALAGSTCDEAAANHFHWIKGQYTNPDVSDVINPTGCDGNDSWTYYIDTELGGAGRTGPQGVSLVGAVCPDGYNASLNGVYTCIKTDYYTRQCDSSMSCCQSKQGNPIDIVTGNKSQTFVDYVGVSPYPLLFRRYYNSSYPKKWSYDFTQHIKVTKTNTGRNTPYEVSAVRSNGAAYGFRSYARPAAYGFTREWIPTSTQQSKNMLLIPVYGEGSAFIGPPLIGWELDFQGNKEIYDVDGKLVEIQYENGNNVKLIYSGGVVIVKNIYGDKITLITNISNELESLITSNGTTQFNYIDDELTFVNYSDGTQTKYHYVRWYGVPYLSGLTDRRGVLYSNWGYTSTGKAISSYHAGDVDKVSIPHAFNSVPPSQVVTNSRDSKTTYNFDKVGGAARVTGITDCRDCAFKDASFDYKLNGNLNFTIYDGIQNNYNNYDDSGNVLSVTEAVSTIEEKTHSYTYDARFYKKVSSITEPSVYTLGSKVTSFIYDDFANIKMVTVSGFEPDGTPISRSSTYKYLGPFNQISEVNGPRTDVNDILFLDYYPNDIAQSNNRARLSSIRTFDGEYLQNNVTYTATGKIESEDRANNLHIDYSYYPGNDRLLDMQQTDTVSGDMRITRWTYLATGEVESITEGFGSTNPVTLTLGYDDARRLRRITDGLGNYFEYVLDTEGNVENEEIYDAGGVLQKKLAQTFDGYNRLDVFSQLNENKSVNFNADGTIDTVTDGKSAVSKYEYDSLKRLTRITENLGGLNTATANVMTQFSYDVNDNLTVVADANSGVTTYVYDDLGNLLTRTSPDTGKVSYDYDIAGNIVQAVDAKAQLFSYSYDAFNRLSNSDAPGTEDDVSYVYDSCLQGFGKLCQTQRNYSKLNYSYNAFGEVAGIDQSLITWVNYNQADNALSYSYNAAGLVNKITYPSGAIINYSYNAAGKINNVSLDQNGIVKSLSSNINYKPFGPESVQTYGNSIGVYGFYDTAYRSSIVGDPMLYTDIQVSYDGNGNIRQSTYMGLSEVVNQSYIYDELNRLSSSNGQSGSFSYSYDQVGNKLSKTQDGVIDNLTYQPNSNILSLLSSETIITDDNGNISNLRGMNLSFTSDNRLKDVSTGGSYEYNGNGERSIKHVASPGAAGVNGYSQSTIYLYGLNGELLAEIGPTGQVKKEYIYLNGKPLVMLHHQPSSNESILRADMDNDGDISFEDWLVWYFNHYATGDVAYDATGDGVITNADINAVVACFLSQGSCVASSSTTEAYYIHNDHLGTPKMLTNRDGQPVWRSEATPFGKATVNDDVDGDGVAVEFNIRQPGQYYDAESGLYYNYFRYYDPSTGRYITSDPIGLGGGMNTYAYVGGNPLKYSDPSGLCPWCVAGAVVSGGINAYGQYQQNGGFNNFDLGSLAASTAAGALGGGLGTLTKGLAVSGNIVANTVGGAAIGAGVTAAKNMATGSCDSVGDAAINGAVFSGLGASVGNAASGAFSAINRSYYNSLPLSTRLLFGSNALHGTQSPLLVPGGVTVGNILGTGTSNIPGITND